MIPLVLVPLAVARVKAPDAYYQAVSIPDQAPAVINCFSEVVDESHFDEWQRDELDRLEMTMYRICHQPPPALPPAYVSLEEYAQEGGPSTLDDRHLSRRLTNIDKGRAKALLKKAHSVRYTPVRSGIPVHDLTFATLQSITSRFDAIWPRD